MLKSLYSSKRYTAKKNHLLVRKKREVCNIGAHIRKKRKLYIRLVVLWGHYPEQDRHGTNHYENTDNSITKLDT